METRSVPRQDRVRSGDAGDIPENVRDARVFVPGEQPAVKGAAR